MDTYQITMAYAYWKGTHARPAAFDLLFRKNPFNGEFTVFAGLEECLRFVSNFRFTPADIAYVKNEPIARSMDPRFFDYLARLDCSGDARRRAARGKRRVPARPPHARRGPADRRPARRDDAAEPRQLRLPGRDQRREAQARRRPRRPAVGVWTPTRAGPRRGVPASRYAYVGGFDATSNLEAGRQFGIPVKGTHTRTRTSRRTWGGKTWRRTSRTTEKETYTFYGLSTRAGTRVCAAGISSGSSWSARRSFGTRCARPSRLVSAVTTARPCFPRRFGGTRRTSPSWRRSRRTPSRFPGVSGARRHVRRVEIGVPNFLAVALALKSCGYEPVGVRLDSGDLSYLSLKTRKVFEHAQAALGTRLAGVRRAPNRRQQRHPRGGAALPEAARPRHHRIRDRDEPRHVFAPARAGVRVQARGDRREAQDQAERGRGEGDHPGRKHAYRLFLKKGEPVMDVMLGNDEPPPRAGERMLCRHPFISSKRAYVVPWRVEPLYHRAWDGAEGACRGSRRRHRRRQGEGAAHIAMMRGPRALRQPDAV